MPVNKKKKLQCGPSDYLLPLSVQTVVDLLVGVGEHDDEDPEEHHAHCARTTPPLTFPSYSGP